MIALEQSPEWKVRTEESEEYSTSSIERSYLQQSTDSIYIIDDYVALQIKQIHKLQTSSMKSTHYSSQSYRSSIDNHKNINKKSLIEPPYNPKLYSFADISPLTVTRILTYQKCPNIARTDIHNRAYGAMFGIIIGDSIGAYVINKTTQILTIEKAMLMEGGGAMNLLPGEGSDQWQISMALAEGLIAGKGSYNRQIIAQKYLQWIQSHPNDLPVVFGIAFSQIRKNRSQKTANIKNLGQQLLKSSLKNAKQQSCLGLVRLVPLVIWAMNLQDNQFEWVIRQQMRLIAPNQLVVESALIFAQLLRIIITTGDITAAYNDVCALVSRSASKKMTQLWKLVEYNEQVTMNSGNSSNLKFPFCFAIWEALRIDTDDKDPKKQYIDAIVRVLSRGFNCDTNSSIVMALVGAVLGYNNIPNYFRNKIINSSKVPSSKRTRSYSAANIVELVNQLMKEGPIFLD